MKNVLFLGAGFSKPWNLPVMNDFFGHSRLSNRLTSEEKQFLENLQKTARSGISMLDGSNTNLEHVLSFALMSQGLYQISDNGNESNYHRLCRILQKVFVDVDISKLNHLRDVVKDKFLNKSTLGNDETTIITTNYDLNIEFALKQLGYRTYLPVKWEPCNNNGNGESLYSKNIDSICLCKLHGSLNWYTHNNNSKLFQIEDAIKSIHIHSRISELESRQIPVNVPLVYADDYIPPSPPNITPPTLYKVQPDKRFDSVWSSAQKALSQADRLVFIGYSFPDSDTHMRYFIAASLVDNVKLETIDIVDPYAEIICDNLRNTDNIGSHFRKLLSPNPAQWEHQNTRILF